MKRSVLAVSFVAVFAGTSVTAAHAGPKALEARLLAPCCWASTLDIHGSELAQSLRTEIETRSADGESDERIQADLVAGYGARMVAARSDASIREMTGWLTAVIGVAAIALALFVRASTRQARRTGSPPVPVHDELDTRIDEDLNALD